MVADPVAATLLPGEGLFGRSVVDQFDPGDHAALADVAHVRHLGDPGEVLVEPGDLGDEPGQRLLLLEHVERGQGDCRPERVAAVGVAVEERPPLGIGPQKGPPDLIGRQRRRQGQIPAR